MLLSLFIVAGILFYLVCGVFTARGRYASEMSAYDGPSSDTLIEQHREVATEMSTLRHDIYCNLRFSTMAHKGCDCSKSTEWASLQSRKNAIIAQKKQVPSVSAGTVFLWWVYGVVAFIKSGYRPQPKSVEAEFYDNYLNDPFGVRQDPRYNPKFSRDWAKITAKFEEDKANNHPLAVSEKE